MIYGFWLYVNGEKEKLLKRPENQRNVKVVVGDLDIIDASEIDGYLTQRFYSAYEIYENWKLGLGLPRGLSWDQQPYFIIDILKLFIREDNKRLRGNNGKNN